MTTTAPTRRSRRIAAGALATAVLALGGGTVGTASADAAQTFRSKTGNLFCKASRSTIACESRASGVRYVLSSYGYAYRTGANYRGVGNTTLGYGMTYRVGRFRVRSGSAGFTVTNRSGHGFFIERFASYRF
ncbi:hypothetical protein [Patulibacter defluvii]|uniref:hypothetical protein n=1 Tax=Patulibacter defluvii TaxID=3095358 RepID=UPI002A74838A|nr:hypothetical protein [Patulibacter sp. DM4]